MKKIHYDLINYLKSSFEEKTGQEIANILKVSSRSVNTYVRQINKEYTDLIRSSSKGYSLDEAKYASSDISNNNNNIPQNSKERVNYILNSLIKKGSYNLYDFAEDLFVSEATIRKDLNKIRKIVSEFDLTIESRNNDLSVEGKENNKRKLLSSLICNESVNNFFDYKVIDNYFDNIDIMKISDIVRETLSENQCFINDFSLINLVLHIAITIERLHEGFTSTNKQNISFVNEKDLEIAKILARKLEKEFPIVFSQEEVNELCLLFISRAQRMEVNSINPNNLKSYIGEENYDLVINVLKQISNEYLIDLATEDFVVRFALHINNLLIRAISSYYSKNPLTDSIRYTCPLIYDTAVEVANIIQNIRHIYISEDEIAYIALHLGTAIEEQRLLSNRVSATLFYPDYYNMKQNVYQKISDRFRNELIITDVITDINDLDEGSDFLISTIKFLNVNNIQACIISPFVTANDIRKIKEFINVIQLSKKKTTFRNTLEQLIDPSLFEISSRNFSKEEIIHYLSDKFLKLGYVDENYEDKINERENLSGTAYDRFAIPHTLKMDAKKTGINIIILKNPVIWNNHKVSLVIMLAFNKNNRNVFNEVFGTIAELLIDPNIFSNVTQATDYNMFISTLVDSLEEI